MRFYSGSLRGDTETPHQASGSATNVRGHSGLLDLATQLTCLGSLEFCEGDSAVSPSQLLQRICGVVTESGIHGC